MLTFSAQNSTNDVLSNSSKWFHDTVKRRSMLILAGAERVKEWLVTAYQLQCKLAALNFLLETSSLVIYLASEFINDSFGFFSNQPKLYSSHGCTLHDSCKV